MPELPEVKNTTDYVHQEIAGLEILDFWSDWYKYQKVSIYSIDDDSFDVSLHKDESYRDLLKKNFIDKVTRVGKNIYFCLSNSKKKYIWHAHMKMTGHFIVIDSKLFTIKDNKIIAKDRSVDKNHPFFDPYNKYIHIYLQLSKNKTLAFSDLRKFGKSVLYPLPRGKSYEWMIGKIGKKEKLGPDAWDVSLSDTKLEKNLKKKNRPIKQNLLDQELLAGIGNIYADEILFASNILPTRKSQTLTDEEVSKIKKNMKKILAKSIKHGGTSESDYRLPTGEKGQFQNYLKVYRLDGETCSKCKKAKIEKTKIAGRYSRYCSNCQT